MAGQSWWHLRITPYPRSRMALVAFQINTCSCGGMALAVFEINTYTCGRTALVAFVTNTYSCSKALLVAFEVNPLPCGGMEMAPNNEMQSADGHRNIIWQGSAEWKALTSVKDICEVLLM